MKRVNTPSWLSQGSKLLKLAAAHAEKKALAAESDAERVDEVLLVVCRDDPDLIPDDVFLLGAMDRRVV